MANKPKDFTPGDAVWYNKPIRRGIESKAAKVLSTTDKKVKIDCEGEKLAVAPALLSHLF